MKTIPQPLLDEIVDRLVAEFEPEQIILYGSHAWGVPHEDSDIDLLVIVAHSDERPIDRAVRAHRCLGGVPFSKDLLVKTRAEVDRFGRVPASLEAQILSHGRVLYGRREAGLGARLAPESIG
jgi:predicted nucleotidyltransferase